MNIPKDLISKIAQLPLFASQPPEMLEKIAKIAQIKRYHKGQTVFSEGDPGNGFYMVTMGRVKIFKISPEGKEQILHVFGPGEPFGEVAVFEGRNFPASAEALEALEVLFIGRNDFIDLIQKNPEFTLKMLSVLSLRLRLFAHLIEDLSLKDVPSRLARYLLLTAEKQKNHANIELEITKAQLASLLGTIPETLSRIFTRFQNSEIIVTKGNQITVLDRDLLQEIADGSFKL